MTADSTHLSPRQRVGTCVIVGLPNVGKSTLLNRAVGQRLVAVSPKPQTSRHRVLGIYRNADEAVEIAFIDTPGMQPGRGALRQFMQDEALGAAADGDVALLVVDATDRRHRQPSLLAADEVKALAHLVASRPLVVALNKVDRVAKVALLPLIAEWAAWRADAEIVPIAALTGDGLSGLLSTIGRRLPEGESGFPSDLVTDRAERFIAEELIREQLYLQLGRELPYASAVVVETWALRAPPPAPQAPRAKAPAAKSKKTPAGKKKPKADRAKPPTLSIGAVIVVERESQKAIVVGKGGSRIKELGIAARKVLSESLQHPVHLSLFVKVMPDWSSQQRSLAELGYGKR